MYLNLEKPLFERKIIEIRRGPILISTGFNCSQGPIPRRLAAYLIPGLWLGNMLESLGYLCEVEFYFAKHFFELLNNCSARDWLGKAIKYLTNWIEKHWTRVPQYQFRVDRPIEGELSEVIDFLAQKLQEFTNERIKRFAEKRGGWPAWRYIAAHTLYMRDPITLPKSPPSILQNPNQQFKTIIMVGGPPEKLFWEARQYLLTHLGKHDQWESIQVFTPIGRRPTYHYLPNEPTIDNGLGLEEINDPDVLRDLKYLILYER